MSTSVINVWVTNLGDPGSIANDAKSGLPHAWVIAVSHTDGRVLNWSEARYRFHKEDAWKPVPYHTPPGGTVPGWWCDSIPTLDGHVELEVPPGTYVVRGSMHTWFVHGLLYGNWATDHGIIPLGGGDEGCVMLYAPTAIACWIPLFHFVLPLLVQRKLMDHETGRKLEAIRDTLKPEAGSPFEQAELQTLRRHFEQMEKPLAGT